MKENPFGDWDVASDGRNHYFLGGKPLCGRKVRDKGPAPTTGHDSFPDTSKDCPDCKEMNELRWLAAS